MGLLREDPGHEAAPVLGAGTWLKWSRFQETKERFERCAPCVPHVMLQRQLAVTCSSGRGPRGTLRIPSRSIPDRREGTLGPPRTPVTPLRNIVPVMFREPPFGVTQRECSKRAASLGRGLAGESSGSAASARPSTSPRRGEVGWGARLEANAGTR